MVSKDSIDYTNLPELTSKLDTFESEDCLIEVVTKCISDFVQGKFIFSTELPVGAGVVDIIVGEVEKNFSDIIYEPLTQIEAFVLSRLYYKRKLRVDTIARRANLPSNKVQQILIKLCKMGFCIISNSCYLRAKPLVKNLVSIEGKIKNWKKALQQAIRNQLFSNRSFVVLDAKYSKPALQNIDLFKEHYIGLAIVFTNGSIKIVYNPPTRHPLAPIMPIIAQTLLLAKVSN